MLMATGNNFPALSLVTLALALAAPGSVAQQSFLIDAGPCLTLGTAVERLVCFEQQVREAQELQGVAPAVVTRPAPAPAAAAQQSAPPSAPQAAAPRQEAPVQSAAPTGVAAFGLREEADPDATPEELLGTVASVREFAPNQLVVTLSNGQIWRQSNSKRYPLKEGQSLRIYATRWGNDYRLTVQELGGFIQVERVK